MQTKPNIDECPICGSKDIISKSGTKHFAFKAHGKKHTILVKNLSWEECASCHETFYDEKARNIIETTQFNEMELLSPKQLIAIRKRLGCSQASMAALLGVGGKSYCRWETGISIHSRAMDNLIRHTAMRIESKKENKETAQINLNERFKFLPNLERYTQIAREFLTKTPETCCPVAMMIQQGASRCHSL